MNVDLKLLAKQKKDLVNVIAIITSDKEVAKNFTKRQVNSLDGILNLLDAIQDANEPEAIRLRKAMEYLSAGSEEEVKEMLEAMEKHDDPHDIIDDVPGVVVWEKVEGKWLVGEFLRHIEP